MGKVNKKPSGRKFLAYALTFIAILLVVAFVYFRKFQERFEAPRKDTPTIQYTIQKDTTLQAVISDLHYFDFIKDEKAFIFALEHTQDNKHEGEIYLRVGKGSKTINKEATYAISQSMSAWQIADILLNQGEYTPCNHGCPDSNFNPELLPGGELAPTLKQKYEWVKTYDDCIKAIGRDGGQVTSEQAFQRTGHRICNTADGRYFVQGQQGFTDYPPYP